MIPEYITGPVIGAAIGSFTNFIAVKMLFYPRKEILLFGHLLPFTPGAIPKGKSRVAKAVGNAVASSLLTKDDIEAMVLSKEIEDEVADVVLKHLTTELKEEICVLSGAGSEEYCEKKDALCNLLSRKIVESIDVVKLMEDYGAEYLKNRIHSNKIGRLVSGEWIDSIAASTARDIQDILKQEGADYVRPIVGERLSEIDSKSAEDIMLYMGMKEGHLREAVIEAFRKMASSNIEKLLDHIDIATVISDKINAMDEKELERLIITVMKKELRTIVGLGGLIGFVLGLLNCLI